ncbi:MAG: RDD family protein [Cyanobacteria bacterium HKST-UBA02]|nr:RDD family protein [Cyanobacteria bacterium HKST-UBA02]
MTMLRLSPVLPVAMLRPFPGRRFVAAWAYDFLASFWIAKLLIWAASPLPGVGAAAESQVLFMAMLIFLTRDRFPIGPGLGKYLLGLRTIDRASGSPASLTQSIARNFIIVGPFLIYQLLTVLVPGYPELLNGTFMDWLKSGFIIYAVAILLIENQLLYMGEGRRLSDRLAGTSVIYQQ